MKWIRALAPALLAFAISLLILGRGDGARGTAPEFIRVSELAPHDVEVGDRLTLLGDGFPSGKTAHIVFRGSLHRPGEPAVHGAQIAATGNVVSPERVEVEFSEPMERLFASTALGLVHTTFEGDVEVGFAASTAGAPPMSGRLMATNLDVRPSVPANEAGRALDGVKVLAALGIHATTVGSGLSIDSVQPGSRAHAAGLAPGDVLARFDGVRVASPGDVVPAPGVRKATVQVFRGREIAERAVSVEGISATLPSARAEGPIVVLAALALVLCLVAPLPVPLARRVQRVASHLRSRLGSAPRSANTVAWRRAFGQILADAWPSSAPSAIADAVALGLLATFSFGPTLVSARVDVALLFGIAASALTATALTCQPTAWRGVRCAAHVAWQHSPAVVALATVVVGVSSLKLPEIARAQGGMPWEWLAFRNPATLMAMLIVGASGRIDPHIHARDSVEALVDGERADSPPEPPIVRAICRLHRTLIAGITATLFLGGWILPGLTAPAVDGSMGLQVLGALLLLGKTGLVLLGVACARLAGSGASDAQRSRRVAGLTLPLSFAALAGSLLWSRWGLSATSQAIFSTVLAVVAGLAVTALADRVRFALVHPNGDGHLGPFL
jgi:NADH-quinone oxidoreductase subunit H